ncbi:MAG: S49 family peptidase, partial [Comamonas sp.]
MTTPLPPGTPGSEPVHPAAPDLWAQARPESAAPASASSAAQSPGWEREVLENLVMATIREQRAARRWRLFGRMSWLLVLLALGWMMFGRDVATTTVSGPHTAVVDIKGEIATGAEASAEFVVAAMRSAFEDSGSRAVVLLINSPGGSPVQA